MHLYYFHANPQCSKRKIREIILFSSPCLIPTMSIL